MGQTEQHGEQVRGTRVSLRGKTRQERETEEKKTASKVQSGQKDWADRAVVVLQLCLAIFVSQSNFWIVDRVLRSRAHGERGLLSHGWGVCGSERSVAELRPNSKRGISSQHTGQFPGEANGSDYAVVLVAMSSVNRGGIPTAVPGLSHEATTAGRGL